MRSSALARLAVAHLLGLAFLTASAGRADAAPSLAEKATAQALFEEGLELMGAKRYAEACPKLEESERLDPALGTRFRLSECDEATGRLASAWAGFLEVADIARSAGQLDRERVARARAAEIEPRLSRVKVVVNTPDTPGLEVAHDHVIVGRAQWGMPVPIDPGTYTVTATAPHKRPWRGSVTVAEDGVTATITVPGLDDARPELGVRRAPRDASPSTEGAPRASGQRIAGFALIGVGVAGVVTGGAMGLVAKANYNSAGSHCGPMTCDASGESTINGARHLADAATAVFVIGAAAGVGGAVLVWTAPSREDRPRVTTLHLGPGSLSLEGVF